MAKNCLSIVSFGGRQPIRDKKVKYSSLKNVHFRIMNIIFQNPSSTVIGYSRLTWIEDGKINGIHS